MNGYAVAFEDVHFAYGDVPVLAGVDFTIPAGGITALMGPSGCGKSTVLALAAGLLAPTSGKIRSHARRSAIVFQDPTLLPWRTALTNVAFALKADRISAVERRERAARMLSAVGLTRADQQKFPRQLSGGMRQRVALARAMVTKPDLLLLDESFRALDAELAKRMHALVKYDLSGRGAAALIVTHDAGEAHIVAEQVMTLTAAPAGQLRTPEQAPSKPNPS
ncbi:ABC transporter ATP-binding protein [Tropicimonas marinistellae]|uniref:ABC transporter ATP-binding protein n=1 Tax=Tropicimonas marinistellae TaxID=1739787 RepID=UPI000836E1A6|nr:ATP-binding cassette domain-containing protein [Tropicimonas marinistellae]